MEDLGSIASNIVSAEQGDTGISKPKPKGPKTTSATKNFLANYMDSPMYKKRLINFNITTPTDSQDLLNTAISSINGPGSIAYTKQSSSKTDTQHARFPITQGKSNINIDRGQIGYINNLYDVDQQPDHIMAHELSHVSRQLSPEEEDLIGSLNKKKDEATAYSEYKKSGVVDPFSTFLDAAYSGTHDARPNEIKADLDALRYSMFKKGIYNTTDRDMTIEDYKKASQDSEIKKSLEFKRLMDRFKPEDIIKLNNTIAANNVNSNNQNIS